MTALVRALALFTVVPVRSHDELTSASAAAALLWLPWVGAGVGAVAGLPMAAVRAWSADAAPVGAVLAVALLVLVTRALHLDGLADTVDGLGSGTDRARALEIMRRGDIGPFGACAIVLVVLLDVGALLPGRGVLRPVAELAVAAATGRVAVLLAAHRRVPSARAHGFGAYVAGSVSTPVAGLQTVAVLGSGVALAAAGDASLLAWPLVQLAALMVAGALLMIAIRRFGGVTGDVFGALIELTTALTLAGVALT